MKKYHINLKGNVMPCEADLKPCKFGSADHFESKEAAQQSFEDAAEKTPLKHREKFKDQSNYFAYIAEDSLDSEYVMVGDKNRDVLSFSSAELAKGNSKIVADYMKWYTEPYEEDHDDYDDYTPPQELSVTSYNPRGPHFSDDHYANYYIDDNGQKIIVDYGFSEFDENENQPYVGTEEQWKRDIKHHAYMGSVLSERTIKLQRRSGTLPVFPAGEKNPLLDKAVLEEPEGGNPFKGQKDNYPHTRFLSVDGIRVAAVQYGLDEDGKTPKIWSAETRKEYRNQGYMTKLYNMLAEDYNVPHVTSAGSYTPDGYAYMKRYHDAHGQTEGKINFPYYQGENKFSFIHDWVDRGEFN